MNRIVIASVVAFAIGAIAAPSRAAGDTERAEVLALIVTNNHSSEAGRPELHYADDDGAKYYDLFRMLGRAEDVELLTDFDRDSERLFPEARAIAHSPTKAEVARAVARLAARARAAAAAGRRSELYFVFAGHGDVDRGRGYLELRDGRITSDDVEQIVHAIPAGTVHVILDSCNSFFVLSPRKPGGRQVAVTEQAAQSLASRLPNVGVFLSTSAEAEVYEWSELQSGIFSHAVRSGLAGAADANHDGVVSYDELRAFVETATSRVKNPLYRPRVFARAPGGRADAPIVDLTGAHGRKLAVAAGPKRLTVRDPDELPWIDVNEEPGAATTLLLPERWAARATIDERGSDGALVRYAVGSGDGAVQLATLASTGEPLAARGTDELLSTLFAAPFGPNTFAEWQAEVGREPPPVYGVSVEDAQRMDMLLAQVATAERGTRRTTAVALAGIGIVMAAGEADVEPSGGVRDLTIASSVAMVGASVYSLLRPSDGERLYADYVTRMADPAADKARVVADTERRLNTLADRYASGRHVTLCLGLGFAVAAAASLVINERATQSAADRDALRFPLGATVALGAVLGAYSLQPTPVEQMRDLWTHDPGISNLPRLGVAVAPAQGGGYLAVAGSF